MSKPETGLHQAVNRSSDRIERLGWTALVIGGVDIAFEAFSVDLPDIGILPETIIRAMRFVAGIGFAATGIDGLDRLKQ